MRTVNILKTMTVAGLVLLASPGVVLAADAAPPVAPGPFEAPPAFPTARARQDATVRPGPFDAPPAYGAPVTRVYNWTGFYLGLNGGGAFGNTNWGSIPDNVTGNASNAGGLFGGTIGYALQAGDAVVLGIEVDAGLTSIGSTVSPASCAPNCELKVPWLGTARIRLGYSFGALVPYATGGVAIGTLEADIAGAPFGTQRSDNLGWTAGGGVEFVITGDWRAKAEYLYVDLNGFSCFTACGGGPISFNFRTNVFRAGVNYRLWAD
jgi:outer membrane immunogenic protein